ncbi:DMT family transporter [Lentzea sp.]|uniref:DMT family transporter n=1 Tax=Lentzea sp. TaxID=56099 RepID=UPI002ED3E1E7
MDTVSAYWGTGSVVHFALLASALLAGCLLAVQASVNLQLTKAVGTPYGASTLQLGVATALLAVLAVAVGAIGAVALVPSVEPWHLLGGLASPLYITSGILLFPRLGALAAAGLFVTGQTLASLALDGFGLLGIPRHPLSAGVVVGVLAVLAGITVVIRAQDAGLAPGKRVGWIGLGVVAGAVLPVQGAVNAALRADLHAPVTVALISFVVATLAISVVLLLMRASDRTPAPRLAPLRGMPWWGWLGGVCAAVYVTATFMLMPEIGAATTVVLTVTGQQLASAVVDHGGLFRMPRRRFTPARAAGLALLVAGSLLVQLF